MVAKRKEQSTNLVPAEAEKIVAHDIHAVGAIANRWHNVTSLKSLTERDQALTDTRVLKALHDEAEKKRREIVDPLNASVKKINALFKPLTSQCDAYEHELKSLVIAFDDAAKRAAIAEAEKRAKKIEKQSPELAQDIREQAATNAVPQSAGVSNLTVWRARVVDFNAIPREFLCLDETKLNTYVRALKADAKIPGVEVYAETVLRVGGAK